MSGRAMVKRSWYREEMGISGKQGMGPTAAFIPPVVITSEAAPGLLWGF